MTAPLDLEFYGNLLRRMDYHSLEYYLAAKTSESQFNGDPELKDAYIAARDAINQFIELIYDRIDEGGGTPEAYFEKS